jgi:eukaryotic-like serine/threonine-protein kinase
MLDDGKPAPVNVLRWASRPTDDAELRNFLKSRLLLYFRILGTLFTVMYVVGFLAIAIVQPSKLVEVHVHPGKLINLAAVVVMSGFWVLLRRSDPNDVRLRVTDFGAVFSISLGIGLGCFVAPSGYHLEFAILVILVFLLILRAALVPSTAPWTAFVGLACSVPFMIGGYQLATRSAGNEYITPSLITVALGVWCLAATAATTVVSHVIYGLVSQVREAQQLGRYMLKQKIGEGGMGEVYRAEHAMLRRPTAIKLLLPGRVSAEALERFEREVQLTSRLSHPNTVMIYDYGRTPDGIFYYAMEFLDGVSLDALVAAEGPQSPGPVVRTLLQVAGALAEAHDVGLIHRDVKPANIMVCDRGGAPIVKVFDFGLVKKIDTTTDQVALTNVNAITGTPLYLAPESILHSDGIDGRIDIYALGAVGYFLLTGTPVFDGRTVVEVCGHHLHTPPEPPSMRLGSALPAKLEALILACLAKDRDKRPRDAHELLAMLSECETESPFGAAEARAWWSRFRRASPRAA